MDDQHKWSVILFEGFGRVKMKCWCFELTMVRPSRSSPRKRATREIFFVDLSVISTEVSVCCNVLAMIFG